MNTVITYDVRARHSERESWRTVYNVASPHLAHDYADELRDEQTFVEVIKITSTEQVIPPRPFARIYWSTEDDSGRVDHSFDVYNEKAERRNLDEYRGKYLDVHSVRYNREGRRS